MSHTPTRIPFDNQQYYCTGPSIGQTLPNYFVLTLDPPAQVEELLPCLEAFVQQYPHLYAVNQAGKHWFLEDMPAERMADAVQVSHQEPEEIIRQPIHMERNSQLTFIVAADGRYLIMRMGHTLGDGHTGKLILSVVLDAYRARLNNEAFEFPQFTFSTAADYIASLNSRPGQAPIRFGKIIRKNLLKILFRKRLEAIPLNQYTAQEPQVVRYQFPPAVMAFASQCQAQDPAITLHDVLTTVLLHSSASLWQLPAVHLVWTSNFRHPQDSFVAGNLSGGIFSAFAPEEAINLGAVQRVSQDRRTALATDHQYSGLAQGAMVKINGKSYPRFAKSLQKKPFGHIMLSNIGSFPTKTYPHHERLAQMGIVKDFVGLTYQSGLSTIVVFSKSKGHAPCLTISGFAAPETLEPLFTALTETVDRLPIIRPKEAMA